MPALPLDGEYPPGPANRPAAVIVGQLAGIPDLQPVGTELQRHNWMYEFHLPDRDPHYPSAFSLDRDTGKLREFTLRFGPLGDQSEVDDGTWRDLEGKWTDVVLDASSGKAIRGIIDGRNIDLGDRWVAEEVRPHVRVRGDVDTTYDIPPKDFAEFIVDLVERFDDRFGTFHDRRYSEEYRDYFRGA